MAAKQATRRRTSGEEETHGGSAAPVVQGVAEYLIPGGSLIAAGRAGEGVLHLGAAAVAGALLGPVGILLVKANSFSRTITHRNLHEHF